MMSRQFSCGNAKSGRGKGADNTELPSMNSTPRPKSACRVAVLFGERHDVPVYARSSPNLQKNIPLLTFVGSEDSCFMLTEVNGVGRGPNSSLKVGQCTNIEFFQWFTR